MPLFVLIFTSLPAYISALNYFEQWWVVWWYSQLSHSVNTRSITVSLLEVSDAAQKPVINHSKTSTQWGWNTVSGILLLSLVKEGANPQKLFSTWKVTHSFYESKSLCHISVTSRSKTHNMTKSWMRTLFSHLWGNMFFFFNVPAIMLSLKPTRTVESAI